MTNPALIRRLALRVAAVALLLNFGCAREELASLRVGINAWPGYEFLYLAQAYRIMAAREGITPEEFRKILTDGIRPVPASDQADYLRPSGKLAGVIDASDRILRQSGQTTGPDRRGDAYTGAFAQKGSGK